MSSQIIPLKSRTDLRDRAEFWPQRPFAFELRRANLVAVITNGSAVLGLGNIRALAGKPVMARKGCLFKKFAGIHVYICDRHHADLSRVDLEFASLKNADLTNASLRGAALGGATLAGEFRGLRGCRLEHCFSRLP
jgi:uncharacterized protein YjbI with pentapeptide repeats